MYIRLKPAGPADDVKVVGQMLRKYVIESIL